MSDTTHNSGADSASLASSAAGQESPGKMLAAGRSTRELTLDEVADALNLSPQTVEWLETDNFGALPAAAFTQGYIRNYAKYVGLDADVVVSAYQNKAGKPDVAWESPRNSAGIAELVQRHPGLLITVVVAAVVLLILIVLLVVWPVDEGDIEAAPEIGLEVAPNRVTDDRDEKNKRDKAASADITGLSDTVQKERPQGSGAVAPSATDANRRSSISTATPGSSVTDSGRPGSTTSRFDDPGATIDRNAIDPNDPLAHLPVAKTYPVPASAARPVAEASTSDTSSRSSRSSSEPAETASTQTPAARSSRAAAGSSRTISRRLTPTGSNLVRLEVAEDCWISIKNKAGKELYSALGREGQTYNLTGQGPFSVLLGYAPGASLYLDDRQIQLEPYTRNNVARLVIGQ